MTLSALTAHSNLADVCQKYKISNDELYGYVKEKLIQIIDQRVKITGKQGGFIDWLEAKESVKNILNAKMSQNPDVAELLAFVKNKKGLFEAISNKIIGQLQTQERNQGILDWIMSLFAGSALDRFNYAEKFATTDRKQGRAEYLHVTGTGHIRCDQRAFGPNEVYLNIELHIRAVTVKFDEIAWHKRLSINGSQLMSELKWHDVQHFEITAGNTEKMWELFAAAIVLSISVFFAYCIWMYKQSSYDKQ